MITPEDRERIAAHLLPEQRPVQELLLYQMAESVRQVREHEHPAGEDWFCMNLVAWMGERTGAVLKRLIDEAAEADMLRASCAQHEARLNKLYALEAAGVDNWSGYSYAMDLLTDADDQED